ncbi:osmotically inducible protein C [Terrabacter tumescens]|uniref:Osmotically inducible protein C n=1 Tax=Terrabacter tumescens TaxID=60443 RepID=A0ABQ2I4Z3_9MICO|nr:OsmC family protein [Terrabacter tumescens]GGN00699.1 osmotically inducible protein C [Terrabacter tumescens]
MSESPTDSTTASTSERDPKDLRRVTLTRDSVGRYTARNDRGGSITLSSGTDELSPVELLLAGIAGCTAVDVDTVTTRRAEPEQFEIEVTADKVKDEHGNHLQDIEVRFRVRFPEGDGGDAAREMLPKLVKRSHDEWCTVSRTVEMGTPVTTTVE